MLYLPTSTRYHRHLKLLDPFSNSIREEGFSSLRWGKDGLLELHLMDLQVKTGSQNGAICYKWVTPATRLGRNPHQIR